MQENGYFEQDHMKGFIMHIVEYMDKHPVMYNIDGVISRPGLPSLLILDGASTHLSRAGFEYAVQHRIDINLLHPNLPHFMQVADVGLFGPPGELLTQPAIIQTLKEQEDKDRAKVEKKAAEKREAQELKKDAKAEAL